MSEGSKEEGACAVRLRLSKCLLIGNYSGVEKARGKGHELRKPFVIEEFLSLRQNGYLVVYGLWFLWFVMVWRVYSCILRSHLLSISFLGAYLDTC